MSNLVLSVRAVEVTMGAAPGLYLFDSARLAAWGIGALLVYLAGVRGVNMIGWHFNARYGLRAPRTRLTPVAAWPEPLIVLAGALIGMMPMLAFTPAVLGDYVDWLRPGSVPALSIAAIWLLIAAEMLAIFQLALPFADVRPRLLERFSPGQFMLSWVAGWIVLAHALTALEFLA